MSICCLDGCLNNKIDHLVHDNKICQIDIYGRRCCTYMTSHMPFLIGICKGCIGFEKKHVLYNDDNDNDNDNDYKIKRKVEIYKNELSSETHLNTFNTFNTNDFRKHLKGFHNSDNYKSIYDFVKRIDENMIQNICKILNIYKCPYGDCYTYLVHRKNDTMCRHIDETNVCCSIVPYHSKKRCLKTERIINYKKCIRPSCYNFIIHQPCDNFCQEYVVENIKNNTSAIYRCCNIIRFHNKNGRYCDNKEILLLDYTKI